MIQRAGNYIKLLVLLLLPATLAAQQQQLKTLAPEQIMAIVRQYHPVVKQANIGVDMARANVTIAKGQFDPVLQFDRNQKTFDGINYYNYSSPELRVPTWYGIEVYAGTESLSGSRTDPQETTGPTSYAGISVPLLKNLVMDKRRAALKQARIFTSLSEAERQSTLNDLQYEAISAYWKWVQHHQVYEILQNAVAVNERRLRLVKIAFQQGERSALDTIEGLTQLQQFQYLRNEAYLGFQNAGVELSAWLWQQNNQPFDMQPDIIPDSNWQKNNLLATVVEGEEALYQTAILNHPDLRQYLFKLTALEVERKLKFQELLPVLNLKYNQLGKGYNLAKTITTPVFENNYRFGLSFYVPLRLSQGRGEYRKAKLKIQDTELALQQKQLLVRNKIRSYRNEALTLLQQVQLQQSALLNFQTLLRGEETRFFYGESSLFLVNSRETKTLEALQKLVEIRIKLVKTLAGLQWAAGLLN
jgi:outer membrane protein TolC